MKKVYCYNYPEEKISLKKILRWKSVVFKDDNFIVTKRNKSNLISVYHVFNDCTTADFYWDMEDLPKYIKSKIAKELI